MRELKCGYVFRNSGGWTRGSRNGRLTHDPAADGNGSGTARIRVHKPVRESTCANPL